MSSRTWKAQRPEADVIASDASLSSAPLHQHTAAPRLGYWSALLCAVFSLAYIVGQLFEWAGLLRSGGGPDSTSTPLGIKVLLMPSLLLGSAFLVLMSSLHRFVPEARRVWTQVGVAFAIAYAVLTGMVYFVQLTVVGPRLARGDVQGIEMFVFVPFDSFLYAVDILGYSFMSVATLFAAFALTGGGVERVARRFMIANGLLLPLVALQMYVHALIWTASLWAVTFPGMIISLAALFRRSGAVVTALIVIAYGPCFLGYEPQFVALGFRVF